MVGHGICGYDLLVSQKSLVLIYDIVDIKIDSIMCTEKNNDIVRKKQEINAKENEIVDALENVSDKTRAETRKEANKIGDSDKE